ncbi:hypothetical protein YK56LOC_68550 [Caballeronia sp. HLA56]
MRARWLAFARQKIQSLNGLPRDNVAMSKPIEDYALLSDGETAALVSRDGSIDWLCWPRFDNDACFAALLGTAENGHWSLTPVGPVSRQRLRY